MQQTIPAAAPVSSPAKAWLATEMLLLYVGGPLLIAAIVWTWRLPLAPMLLLFMLLFVLLLLMDRQFSVTSMLRQLPSAALLKAIFLLLPFGAALVFGLAWWLEPERFLSFPTERFRLWLAVMVLYPLIPVIAQEVIYRVFFWHRYAALFAGRPWTAIVLNAALFGFAHIIMWNLISIVLSFLAGLVLAWRYQQSRSFWAAVIEHGIYGNLIFTAGLGLYFYSGAIPR